MSTPEVAIYDGTGRPTSPQPVVSDKHVCDLEALTPASTSIVADLKCVVHDLIGARDLIYQLTLRDIRIKYKQAAMGFGWAVFMPILVVMAGLLIRYIMAKAAGQALTGALVGGMALKALCWSFFVGAIGLATVSLISNMEMLTKIYFPREVLPFSTLLAQTVDTLIGGAALTLLLPFVGARLTAQLLWVPLLFALLFTFTLAVAVFLSCANLFFRDVKYIVQVLLTFGIFATPVLFEPQMLGQTGGRLLLLNPLSPIMEGFRMSVMDGHNLLYPLHVMLRDGTSFLAWSPWYLLYVAAWAVLALIGSTILFRRAAFAFAEYV
jgi:ABC-type polysaccharide/polyol phosphate export permease